MMIARRRPRRFMVLCRVRDLRRYESIRIVSNKRHIRGRNSWQYSGICFVRWPRRRVVIGRFGAGRYSSPRLRPWPLRSQQQRKGLA